MELKFIDVDQKALEINLNDQIYGTFAEIGAGQEVARHFFKVGAAVGTIAKTMSAYDKIYSDEIYGREESGRYVCQSRLYKMLDHEYSLLIERLKDERQNTTFFAFADTVAAINYARTIKGQGWMGVRFQTKPNTAPNDLVLHVKMLDITNQLQQQAIGILGVNMVYACYHYADDMDAFVQSLLQGLEDRIKIDMIRLEGPDFEKLDNRWLNLLLVKYGLSEVVMIDTHKRGIHASEFLYKKYLMIVRGHFRPPTKVTDDVFSSSFAQFNAEEEVDPEKSKIMAELTLTNLRVNGEIKYDDFISRCEAIRVMGKDIIVSDCDKHIDLVNYLADYKIRKLGLVIGVRELLDIMTQIYTENEQGSLLVAFGELFTQNLTVYAYPALTNDLEELYTVDNLPVPEQIRFLYQFLLDQGLIVRVENYNRDILNIIPYGVYQMIENQKVGWEKFVPSEVAEIIRSENLFGYKDPGYLKHV